MSTHFFCLYCIRCKKSFPRYPRYLHEPDGSLLISFSACPCSNNHNPTTMKVSVVPRSLVAVTLSLCSKPSYSLLVTRRASLSYWTTAAIATTSSSIRPSVFATNQQQQQTNECLARTSQSQHTCRMASSSSSVELMTGYLNAEKAAALDEELMSSPGFTLEQLMELAGLSVAEAVYQVVEEKRLDQVRKPKILVVCGPGNNGGDGLVAARHLVMFGYDCEVVYPKQSKKEHYVNLVEQCKDVGILIRTEFPSNTKEYAAIVDSIFGFSFKGEPRAPFDDILKRMKEAGSSSNPNALLTISVDVPSGWNVDEGDVAKTGFLPDVLVSLTTPKECSRSFTGRHFVGGRFLPPKLAEKYGVKVSS